MFKYYTSKQYRRIYCELEEMGLFSDDPAVHYELYEEYFRQVVIIDPLIPRQIEILLQKKPQPSNIVKTLIFMHIWLQTTCILEDTLLPLSLLNNLLTNAQELIDQRRREQANKGKSSKHAIINQNINSVNKKFNKENFLLEDVAIPYVHYLQKVIAEFEFYNTLKKNIGKTLSQSETWALLNLFNCITVLTQKLTLIWKLLRKSYLLLAQGMAEAINQDIHHFYPKLQKYCYHEGSRLKSRKNSGLSVEQDVQLLKCMSVEVENLNNNLQVIYQLPLFKQINVYEPKYVNLEAPNFQLIKEQQTAMFHVTSTPDQDDEYEDLQKTVQAKLPPIFCDITNQEDEWTFRSVCDIPHNLSMEKRPRSVADPR